MDLGVEIRPTFHGGQLGAGQFAQTGHRIRIPSLRAVVDVVDHTDTGEVYFRRVLVRGFGEHFDRAVHIHRFNLERAFGRPGFDLLDGLLAADGFDVLV